ncbi:MAG: AAA family ATPase [Gemmatimonadales bacterium]|jgi:DNA-binding SARP family transcriptional activator
MIHCRLLGPPELTVDGHLPPPELLWRKNLALLAYLAHSPKRRRSRDHLVGLLWGDKPEAQARHSLREAVRVLRKALGEERLATESDSVALATGALELDTERLETLRAAEAWEEAATLVGGPFMEGFGLPDASAFEDWLSAERRLWQRRSADTLAHWAALLLGRGRAADTVEAALRALDMDPHSSRAVMLAMTALAVQGDRSAALEQFERFTDRLARTGDEPDVAARELAERVRGEREFRLDAGVPGADAEGAESRRAPLVGREREFERVVGALIDATAEPRATAIVLTAEAGHGKSRLLEELVTRARLEGWTVAAVRAVPADREQAWNGVLGLARGGLLDAPGIAAASPSALAAFAKEIPEWADRFGGGGDEAAAMGAALSDVARVATNERPLLLVADDAQWLDDVSLGALIAVPRDLHDQPLAVALGAQPEPAREALDDLRSRVGRDVGGTSVNLHPLDREAMTRLARWALPDYESGALDRLVRRLMVDTAGLPLLALELLHALAIGMDAGTITGAWPEPFKTLDQTLPGDLPDAIVAAIRVGFRRLTAPAQHVLAAAAVLAEPVPATRLLRATGVDERQLHRALDELEWQRWLSADARGYAFIARIVRSVVARDMLTDGQRQRILEAAGE